MCQVSAMCKVQAHNGIAWFEKCLIHCSIGIGSGMRLYTYMLTSE